MAVCERLLITALLPSKLVFQVSLSATSMHHHGRLALLTAEPCPQSFRVLDEFMYQVIIWELLPVHLRGRQ
jgi:hypothetical protein